MPDPIEELQFAVSQLGSAFVSEEGVIAVPSVLDKTEHVYVLASEDPEKADSLVAHAIILDPALLARLEPIAGDTAHRFQLEESNHG